MTPLSELLSAAATGQLANAPEPAFRDDVAVTVVLASEGYPENPVTGRVITGVDAANAREGVSVAHAATGVLDDELVATGGRVLSVVATGSSFAEARERAYAGIGDIALEGAQFRTDIAAKVAR